MLPIKPHFFQPLLPGFENGFSIPLSFYKHFKGKEYGEAVLRSPSGKLWHVKINGRQFEDGWRDFAKYHALHVGDFLVFRHEGDMVYDVMVFDPSSCEREYTSFHVKQEEMETSDSDDKEDISKESDLNNKKFNAGSIPEEEKADFSEIENPYFVVKFTSYGARNAKRNIPRRFARANGLHKRDCNIVLVDQQGRSWLAQLGFKKSDGQDYIGKGWSTFRIANGLKEGDSFIFELIQKGRKPVLEMRRLKRNPTARRTGHSSTKNPHHSAALKASYSNNSPLKIPRDFARRNYLNRRHVKMILTNKRGNTWPVSLVKHKSGDMHTGHGWSAFAEGNGLREGDKFMLELIKEGYMPVMRIYGINKGTRRNMDVKPEVEFDDVKPIIEFPKQKLMITGSL